MEVGGRWEERKAERNDDNTRKDRKILNTRRNLCGRHWKRRGERNGRKREEREDWKIVGSKRSFGTEGGWKG